MALTAALFVSNRFQKAVAAFLCLMAAQLVVASCTPEPAVGFGAVRATVSR